MTQREKNLATMFLGVLVVVGGAAGFNALAFQPYREASARLEKARADLDDKETDLAREKKQFKTLLAKGPRLEQWKKISLPPMSPELRKKKGQSNEEKKKDHIRNLQVEYDRYLRELLRTSGFTGPINILAQEVKPQLEDMGKVRVANTKPPVLYERMPFLVAGQAKLDAVVRMFESFHKANLLQEVRSFTLSQVQKRGKEEAKRPTGLLNVVMTVEALIVPGAEERARLMPEKLPPPLRVLADMKRNYYDITRKDPFYGIAPVSAGSGSTGTSSGQREKAEDVLRWVRLTTLSNNGRRWEAWIYDLARGGPEKRVNMVTLTEFAIKDKYDNKVLDAEVALIDDRQMIFKAGGKYYRITCGEFFQTAVRRPLPTWELRQLGLGPDAKPAEE